MTVRQCQTIHAKRRAIERYGLKLNKRNIMDIVKKIINNQAIFVEKQSCSRSIFMVEFSGHQLKVVYDKTRKSLRSILPND